MCCNDLVHYCPRPKASTTPRGNSFDCCPAIKYRFYGYRPPSIQGAVSDPIQLMLNTSNKLIWGDEGENFCDICSPESRCHKSFLPLNSFEHLRKGYIFRGKNLHLLLRSKFFALKVGPNWITSPQVCQFDLMRINTHVPWLWYGSLHLPGTWTGR